MQNNNQQLTAALIKADTLNESGDIQSAYVSIKWAVMEHLGLSIDQLNKLVLDYEDKVK